MCFRTGVGLASLVLVLLARGYRAPEHSEDQDTLTMRPSQFVPIEPITESCLKERFEGLKSADALRTFGSLSEQTPKLYSLLRVEMAGDRAVPNWRKLVLTREDLGQLQGFTLASKTTADSVSPFEPSKIKQRLEIVSEEGNSIGAVIVYSDSPQHARLHLLEYYRNTSMGLRQHLTGWQRIKGGVGEVCLVALLRYYGAGSQFPHRPSEIQLSDTSVLFFRASVAVQVSSRGRDRARSSKETSGIMNFARQVDRLLVENARKL